jgi:excisionase family DNA binding protein
MRLLTQDEAMRMLKVSRAKLFRLLKAGKIAARKHGRSNLFDSHEIERYLRTLPEWQPITPKDPTDTFDHEAFGKMVDQLPTISEEEFWKWAEEETRDEPKKQPKRGNS